MLEKGSASLSSKDMSNCYANTGFALFYAKSGRMDQSSVVTFLPFFLNELGFPNEIVVKLLC